MKLLITGGSGLVGRGIEYINPKNYECIYLSSKDGDLTSMKDTYNIFNKHKPDVVIHLAANVGGLFKNMNYKVDMLEKNLLINYNVVKCCAIFKVHKLVSCLSTCIFPDNIQYPINEEMLHNGPPHQSNDAYAYSKRMLHIHCKAYQEQYNLKFVCVIPTNIYGPHDNFNLEDAHVIPALIHRCYLAKQSNTPFVIRGSGKPLRQFIHTHDLAKLLLLVLDTYNEDAPIILSPNTEVSINYIGAQIAKEFGNNSIQNDLSFSDGQFKKTADNSKLTSLYPSYKFISIKNGIKNTINWFKTNYATCRK